MCELFAMSSQLPTSISFSLETLARRGGAEGPHRDGWGIAFYEGRDVLLLREPCSASESEWVPHIEQHGPPSEQVILHLRLATNGEASLQNTQPYVRELGGYSHVFAHNGDLPGIEDHTEFKTTRFQRIGETDSERAFCYLMESMADIWGAREQGPPLLDKRLDIVTAFAAKIRAFGPANFIYADGDVLFVHADRRTQANNIIEPPGLHILERQCMEGVTELNNSGVRLSSAQQKLVLVASVPLTDEAWQPMAEGEVLVLVKGMVAGRRLS